MIFSFFSHRLSTVVLPFETIASGLIAFSEIRYWNYDDLIDLHVFHIMSLSAIHLGHHLNIAALHLDVGQETEKKQIKNFMS